MGARHKGRIVAFQTLYRYSLTAESLEGLFDFSWMDAGRDEKIRDDIFDFACLLIRGTLEKLEDIDDAIKKQLENWDFSRLSRIDLAILRISVFSLLYQDSIPASVTIDEAIDIAKEFSTEESYKFINGVLDGIQKKKLTLKETD